MALPSLLLFKGGKLSEVALTGADIKNILTKVTDRPYTTIFYYDIPVKLLMALILFSSSILELPMVIGASLILTRQLRRSTFSIPMVIHLMVNGLFLITQRRDQLQNSSYQNTLEI
jgi:hypothetical protein